VEVLLAELIASSISLFLSPNKPFRDAISSGSSTSSSKISWEEVYEDAKHSTVKEN
jgi:hypothetical protein